MSMTETSKKEENLMELHRAAEASWTTFSYAKPDGVSSGKGFVASAARTSCAAWCRW